MTALPSVPSLVNTLEKSFVWSAMGLNSLYSTKLVQLAANQPLQNAITATIYPSADGKRRMTIVAHIELDTDYDFDNSRKLWTFAEPLGDATVPTGFASN